MLIRPNMMTDRFLLWNSLESGNIQVDYDLTPWKACQLTSLMVLLQIGPLRCWPGGLCLSRSIGDMDVGEYIVPVPYVKQVKVRVVFFFSLSLRFSFSSLNFLPSGVPHLHFLIYISFDIIICVPPIIGVSMIYSRG